MKIKLLNDGGYRGMDDVEFPAEVEARKERGYFSVSREELYRIGAAQGLFSTLDEYAFADDSCEVLS